MRKEVVNRFLGTDPSKQTTSVEKTNFLQCLYREVNKGAHGAHMENVSKSIGTRFINLYFGLT